MKDYRFDPRADDELAEALAYHAQHWAAIGRNLYADFQAAFEAIRRTPTAFPSAGGGARMYQMSPAPYLVIYYDCPGFVFFAAIAHPSRRPGYWRRRTPPRS